MANQIHSFFETHTVALCKEKTIPMTRDMLTSKKEERNHPQAGCLLSTMASAMISQHASDMGKLRQELKNVQRDMKDFKREVTGVICRMEGTLSHMTEVVISLETRSNNVEQRLREEEDRGIVRNKVLTFLLTREKELREKCAALERRLCRKNCLGI
ncbi:coiled-coil domain-containing protein 182 [Pelodiscus sinensis]|uniref:coiled-coil domain-containing protein 182 n=1 Tax=Pelodiscus sinensis TaxID=13735 RepID=UPI0003C49853|nr:coiled-coil domain-containing protein 182 [Pelodiscus sinensis]|eukprot:XP_006138773.1 coiled-coil domain-containing protein 182 [Pelodiscus sinensis]